MFIELPFEYDAHYQVKGGTTKYSAKRVGLGRFQVRDLPEADVYVAFEVGHGCEGKMFTQSFPILTDGRPSRVWAHDDHLYAEFCTVDEFVDRCKQSSLVAHNPLRFVNRGRAAGFHPFSERTYEAALRNDETLEVVGKSKGALRSWSDDEGASVAEVIRERLQDMVAIDGHICINVTEPVIIVAPVGGRTDTNKPGTITISIGEQRPGGDSGRAFPESLRDKPLARTFRIDEIDDARAYAKILSTSADAGQAWDIVDGTVIKTIGRALRHSSECSGIAALAKYAHTVLAPAMGELPSGVVMSWFRLRDAWLASLNTVTTDVIDAVDALAEEIRVSNLTGGMEIDDTRARLNQLNVPEHPFKKVSADDVNAHVLTFAAAAGLEIRRWNSRSENGVEWVSSVSPGTFYKDETCTIKPIVSADALHDLGVELNVETWQKADLASIGELHVFSVEGPHGKAMATASQFGDFLDISDIVGYAETDMTHAYRDQMQALIDGHRSAMDDSDALAFNL